MRRKIMSLALGFLPLVLTHACSKDDGNSVSGSSPVTASSSSVSTASAPASPTPSPSPSPETDLSQLFPVAKFVGDTEAAFSNETNHDANFMYCVFEKIGGNFNNQKLLAGRHMVLKAKQMDVRLKLEDVWSDGKCVKKELQIDLLRATECGSAPNNMGGYLYDARHISYENKECGTTCDAAAGKLDNFFQDGRVVKITPRWNNVDKLVVSGRIVWDDGSAAQTVTPGKEVSNTYPDKAGTYTLRLELLDPSGKVVCDPQITVNITTTPPTYGITVTKKATVSGCASGETKATVDYVITTKNTSSVPVTANLTDTFAPQCAQANVNLGVGETKSFNCTGQYGAGSYTNTVVATIAGTSVSASDKADFTVLTCPPVLDLAITKTATVSGCVAEGEKKTVSFHIKVENKSSVDNTFNVADTLAPACARTDVLIEESSFMEYNCTGQYAAGSYTNTATATIKGTTLSKTAQASFTVLACPPVLDLDITKTATVSGCVQQGQQATVNFGLAVTNKSSVDKQFDVSDALAPNCNKSAVPINKGQTYAYSCTGQYAAGSYTNTATASIVGASMSKSAQAAFAVETCPSTCVVQNVGQIEDGCYADKPWGNNQDAVHVCSYYGLVPVASKVEGGGGPSFTSQYAARLLVTHWGGADCGHGGQYYRFAENVTVGQVITSPDRGGFSFAVYCGCPTSTSSSFRYLRR